MLAECLHSCFLFRPDFSASALCSAVMSCIFNMMVVIAIETFVADTARHSSHTLFLPSFLTFRHVFNVQGECLEHPLSSRPNRQLAVLIHATIVG